MKGADILSKSTYFTFRLPYNRQRGKSYTKAEADLIHAAKPYSGHLDWHDPNHARQLSSIQHASRVAIKDDLPDISGYGTVLIGFQSGGDSTASDC